MKAFFRRLVRKSGFDIIRFNPRNSPVARRLRLLRQHDINLILDVGANTGGYARELRSTGYRGRIVSFEPLSSAFSELASQAARDPLWEVVPLGLGHKKGRHTLHVSRNSESSSILPILPRHVQAFPEAGYTGSEEIPIERLDDIFACYCRPEDNIYLKIDTQGYEYHVLEGARASLPTIRGLQLELSLIPMYNGEPLFLDMITFAKEHGFVLMSIQPVIDDPITGQLLQIDGIFFRSQP